MMVLLHVSLALASMIATTIVVVWPSKARLYTSHSLVALTLVSGTYLAWSQKTHILQTCISGLVYILGISLGLAVAQRRLAAQKDS